ncbi:MAG: hypothetical protein AMXMBFR59_35940 [Rhodanobacteraceae bacterium]
MSTPSSAIGLPPSLRFDQRLSAGFLRIRRLEGLNAHIVGNDDRVLLDASLSTRDWPPKAGPPVPDPRVEPDCPRIALLSARAPAIAAVLPRKFLNPVEGGYWTASVEDSLRDSRFATLPSLRDGMRGTAFLAGPQHLVTAAHVAAQTALSRLAFVFDFRIDRFRPAGSGLPDRYFFPADTVFHAREDQFLAAESLPRNGDDIVLIELDRDTGRPALPLAPSTALIRDAEVAMIGHARQQPVTLITAACSSRPSPRVFDFDARVIRTNIDAFQGNSGSPLLDRQGRALGMHVNALSNESVVGRGGIRTHLRLDEGQAVSIAGRLTPIVAALRALGVDVPD